MTASEAQLDAFAVCETILGGVLGDLEACDRPAVSRAIVAAGQVAWDDCCGQLVVGPERVYRSSEFPVEDATDEICEGGWIAVSIVVLLVRCVPTVNERGEAPSAAAMNAAYASLLRDAAVVWRSVGVKKLPHDWRRALVAQEFVGEQGACVGVETRLTIGLDDLDWCVECPPPDPEPPPE